MKYIDLACKMLVLAKEGHRLGTFKLIDTADDVIDAVVEAYLHDVSALLERERIDLPVQSDYQRERYKAFRELRAETYFLDYPRYIRAVRDHKGLSKRRCSPETDYFLEELPFNPARHPPDRAGLETVSERSEPQILGALA